MRFLKNKKNNIDVDEIFMDAQNIPGFHTENFEGTIEKPIKKNVFLYIEIFFCAVGIFFLVRAGFLEIAKGEYFKTRAEKNYLRQVDIEPERGVVFDRNMFALTINELEKNDSLNQKWIRKYPVNGFLHVLGFLSRQENQYLANGVSGFELFYNDILKGKPGKFLEEINAKGDIFSSGISIKPKKGENILSSLSYDLTLKLAQIVSNTADQYKFNGGAAVVINPQNGEVLSLLSIPDFDPNILSKNPSKETIEKLINDVKKPFFNRAVSGLYSPGSIVKPAIAVGALSEGIIVPEKQILSSSPIVIQNPFSPQKPDIFPDWKQHGWVDMRRAIAVSSDIYFYTVGGGYQDQVGLGVNKIEKYFQMFGFGKNTGIDLPGEKSGYLPDPNKLTGDSRKWGIGDTYHLSIGQGDLQVTPVQMALYASILATGGSVVIPHLVKSVLKDNGNLKENFSYSIKNIEDIKKETFDIVREGMRDAVKYGTASGLSGYPIEIAAKTGTAEVGKTGYVHSWSIGFMPYENPKIAWAVVMEKGPISNTVGSTYVVSQMIQWMLQNKFLDTI